MRDQWNYASTVGSTFSWSQFLWLVFIFVGVPTLIGVVVIRLVLQSERSARTGTGNFGLWATGGVALLLGFLACAGWLSWSADQRGEVRGPGLPAPNAFPTWQVFACGATVVLVCFAAAHLSRWAMAGGLAAAAGTTAGFTTAFTVSASTDITGQSGVGIILSEIGWGVSLGVLMLVRGVWLNGRRERSS